MTLREAIGRLHAGCRAMITSGGSMENRGATTTGDFSAEVQQISGVASDERS